MQIFILFEPDYAPSIWAAQTLSGLQQECAHRKYELIQLDSARYRTLDYDAILPADNRMVIVAGTSVSWMPDALAFFTERQIAVIFISYEPPEPSPLRGLVRMDYQNGIRKLLTYLTACGRSRIALYGVNPNSSSDLIKCHCFAREYADAADAVFYNRASLAECYRAFASRQESFDAVICTNDFAAVSLLNRLARDGVPVPERLFLAGFGNSVLLQSVRPTITSVSLDHVEMGRQAATLYAYLSKQPAGTTVSVRVRTHMIVGGSTAGLHPADADVPLPTLRPVDRVDFFSDREAEAWQRVETILVASDEADRAFLAGLLAGKPYTALENELYLSASALRYRLKRMLVLSGCDSRDALLELLRFCGGVHLFSEKTQIPEPPKTSR